MTQLTSETSSGNLVMSQQYAYNAAGLRTGVTENQMLPDGLLVSMSTAWTYDNDDRLTKTVSSGPNWTDNYTDTYYYDLDSNRIVDIHVTSAGSVVTIYEYNADDEMTVQFNSAGSTAYTYDNNGSQLTATSGSNVTTYTYGPFQDVLFLSSAGFRFFRAMIFTSLVDCV